MCCVSVFGCFNVIGFIFLMLFVMLLFFVLDFIFFWNLINGNGFLMLFLGCDLFIGSWVYDEIYLLYINCLFVELGFWCVENGRLDLWYCNW